ncbi:MAG: hypothetical protein GY727_06355 [Gammaproteobacteria bacterium]|nr:hypothetical protein [Gammaproteobacteria bacterium]MCP4091235.1 hypothetical protein [Gammaproteobacteria bacterium]MCP4278344.1 hypothetical protein [Gammaproteobacteria bacterium]MCP4830921.1 hypothetical protein [Gammaproteobacteria bacterium]MCP4927560.1 hypothetical protein [Gammaproteobacteria bacterium]
MVCKSISALKILPVVVLALVAIGCTNIQPLPSYARSGDIVSMGVAGIKFQTDGMSTLTPWQVTVTLTDANSVVHNVKVLKTFRAFPDHTSNYTFGSLQRDPASGVRYADVEPFDGQWWVTLHLVDPADDSLLPLAVGTATMQISAAGVTDTYQDDGDMSAIPLEILAGTVDKAPYEFYQYVAYTQQRSLTIRPDSLVGVTKIGGLQIKLDYNPNAIMAGAPQIPHLVPISHDPHINIVQHTVDNGDGTHALIAMITNPMGFVPDASHGGDWKIGSSTFKDLGFAVLTADAAIWLYQTNYFLDLAESFYIDENGDKIPTVAPVLGLNF